MPELGERGGTNPSGLWEWIKAHSGLAIASFAALVAAWYLFMRPSGDSTSASPKLSTAAIPSAGGGGSGGGLGSGLGASLPTVTLPFNPDFAVLQAISDNGLRNLYNTAYNLEQQINAATLNGNAPLATQLQNSLTNVQNQIASYTIVDPTTALNTQISTLNQTISNLRTQLGSAPTQAAVDALNQQIATATAQIATLQAQIAQGAANQISSDAVATFQRTFAQNFPRLYDQVFNAVTASWEPAQRGVGSPGAAGVSLQSVFGQWASGIRQTAAGAGLDTSKLTNDKLVALWNNFQTNSGAYGDPRNAAAAIQDFVTRVNAGLIGTPGQITIRTSTGDTLLPATAAILAPGESPVSGRSATANWQSLARGR